MQLNKPLVFTAIYDTETIVVYFFRLLVDYIHGLTKITVTAFIQKHAHIHLFVLFFEFL